MSKYSLKICCGAKSGKGLESVREGVELWLRADLLKFRFWLLLCSIIGIREGCFWVLVLATSILNEEI